MPCIEAAARLGRATVRRGAALSACAVALLLAGCNGGGGRVISREPLPTPPGVPSPPSPPAPPPPPTVFVPGQGGELPVPQPGAPGTPAAAPGQDLPGGRRWTSVPPPTRHRQWEAWKRDAAQRLVVANLRDTYDGVPPEPLLAIPVLEIALQADGHVASMRVLRHPSQARETVQRAMAAVRRAEPFAPVRDLPQPWTWTEVFLYADDGRFKPRTLD